MAIAVNGTRLATLVGNAIPAFTSIALGSSPTAGSTIIVAFAGALSTQAAVDVQDSRGNIYTLLYNSGNPGFAAHLYVYMCKSQHGLQSGDLIYIIGTAGYNGIVTVDEITGLGTRHIPDVSAGNSSSSNVSAFSMGPTGATSYANELVWAVIVTPTIGSTTQTITPGTGYTQQGARVTAGTVSLSVYTEYKIVAATGAQTADGTINTTADKYVGVVLTFPDPQSPESARRGASLMGANVSARIGTNRASSFVGVEVAGGVTVAPPITTRRRPSPIVA